MSTNIAVQSGLMTRRALLALAGGVSAIPFELQAQIPTTPKALIAGVPVLPWLTVGLSTSDSVRGSVQSLMSGSPRPWYREGPSEITGGSFQTVSSVAGPGMLGEPGLRILSMVFDSSKRVQLVILMFQRGWKDANVNSLIQRLTSRYSPLAKPVRIQDRNSETSDFYVFFDMGRFVVEIVVPQYGELIEVNITTKEIHARMRMADGNYELFMPYL